jgi:hypothetical protein
MNYVETFPSLLDEEDLVNMSAGIESINVRVCTRRPNTVLRISHANLTQSEKSDRTVKDGRA